MPKSALMSKRALQALGGLIAGFLLARPLLAADLTGTWEISYQVGQDAETVLLSVDHDGSTLTGEGTLRLGAGDAMPVVVRAGSIRRGDFRFQLTGARGATLRALWGAWHEDEMSGRTDGTFGSRMFVGVRRAARD